MTLFKTCQKFTEFTNSLYYSAGVGSGSISPVSLTPFRLREHEIIIWLPRVLLEDHEEPHELYILLHLQLRQIRYKAGPLLLLFMFLHYVLFVQAFFFIFFYSLLFPMYPQFSASTLFLQLLLMKITVICAIRCGFQQAS